MSDWFTVNKMSINKKTKNFIIFKPRQNRPNRGFNFSINDTNIESVKEAVFLVVIINENANNYRV